MLFSLNTHTHIRHLLLLLLTSSKDGIGLSARGDGRGGGEGDLFSSAITSSLYVLIASNRVIESLRRGGGGGDSSIDAVLSEGARDTVARYGATGDIGLTSANIAFGLSGFGSGMITSGSVSLFQFV